MIDLHLTVSIITVDINDLNIPIKSRDGQTV